jgi:hypothetical protein
MKDLYKRLGVSPGVAISLLKDAIDRHSDENVRLAARAILLSEQRRSYDNAHAQLRRIGQLRANLGLTHSELWLQSRTADFDVPARGHHSQLDALRESIRGNEHSPADSTAGSRRAWWDTALRALAILAGLALWIWFLLPSSEPSREPDVEQQRALSDLAEQLPEKNPRQATTLENRVPSNSPPIPMPPTGVVYRAKRSKTTWPELRIRSGHRAGNFFVKVIELNSQREAARIFVRSGEAASTTLPPGKYVVRYANGAVWYGEEQLFGPRTAVAEGVDPIELRLIESADGFQLLGGELTLEKQVDGNFADRVIELEEF